MQRMREYLVVSRGERAVQSLDFVSYGHGLAAPRTPRTPGHASRPMSPGLTWTTTAEAWRPVSRHKIQESPRSRPTTSSTEPTEAMLSRSRPSTRGTFAQGASRPSTRGTFAQGARVQKSPRSRQSESAHVSTGEPPPLGTYDPPDLWKDIRIVDAGKYAATDKRSQFARLLAGTAAISLDVGI